MNKENYLSLGDSVIITSITGNDSFDAEVLDIITDKIVTIKTTGTLDVAASYTLLRKIRKAKSAIFPEINKIHANVQNIYKKQYGDSLLVASNSLPSFKDTPITG